MLKAREMHLASATVLLGPMGFGHSIRLHTAKVPCLSDELRMVIKLGDADLRI